MNERNFEQEENSNIQESEKPPVLYHASRDPDITQFEPRAESIRDKNEGPVVFGTPELALATMFLVDTSDSWTTKGRFGETCCHVISDRERFSKADKGGWIYRLPSESFTTDLTKGMRKLEWTSRQPVIPIDQTAYKSGLEAMIEQGVQVYFVDKDTFKKIKEAPDHGQSILQSLVSENQRRAENTDKFK